MYILQYGQEYFLQVAFYLPQNRTFPSWNNLMDNTQDNFSKVKIYFFHRFYDRKFFPIFCHGFFQPFIQHICSRAFLFVKKYTNKSRTAWRQTCKRAKSTLLKKIPAKKNQTQFFLRMVFSHPHFSVILFVSILGQSFIRPRYAAGGKSLL